MISYGKQSIDQSDIDAVVQVLESDYLTQGPIVEQFEQAVASKCQAKYSIATNSATSALHIACLALDIRPEDNVWTSPISFVASANCVLYCRANIDFVDIDLATANISIQALEQKLAQAEVQGTLPKAIIVVHMAGLSCDMQSINTLAKKYQFAVIEDASHAIGGHFQKSPIGCCQYSDICVFSFHPVKVITSAEGGMALTNNKRLAEKMAILRAHGITKNPADFDAFSFEQPWCYEQQTLGFNYRLSELHAALGLSQLSKLDQFVDRRNALATRYLNAFKNLPVLCQETTSDTVSAYHLMLCSIDQNAKTDRDSLFRVLQNQGIGCQVHYIPIHLQPYYQQLGFRQGDFPEAERYYQQCLSIPLYPSLDNSKQDLIIDMISKQLC